MKRKVLVSVAIAISSFCAASASAAAYSVRGSVACAGGPVVGAWMHSSGGGSGWASWSAYPGTSGSIARMSRSFSTALPSNIYLNVGCNGTPSKWGSSNRTPTIKTSGGSTLYINTECDSKGSCSFFPRENNTPAAPSTNPAAGTKWCTWRAADYWRKMTGRYPNWNGNAGWWDDNAAATGWAVRSWPRPDSIAVWQPGQASSLGHVGYVADTRVSNGKLQMSIYDRNWTGDGKDRNGVWVNFVSGMKFIVAPPRSA